MDVRTLQKDEIPPQGATMYRDCQNCQCRTEGATNKQRCHCGATMWTFPFFYEEVNGRKCKVFAPVLEELFPAGRK